MPNYLAGMVQPHQIAAQAGQVQSPFELEAQGMQIQSAKNKLLQDETNRNALTEYAQTGEIESLRAAPDLYFKAMAAQQKAIPQMKMTSVGVPGGMQKAQYDPRDPTGTMQYVGGVYQPPSFYEQGPATGGFTSGDMVNQPGIPAQQPMQAPIAQQLPTITQSVTDGVPSAPPENFGALSPKDSATMRMRDITASSKSLEALQKQAKLEQVASGDIKRFLFLNSKTETGPITGAGVIGAGRRMLGDKELQEMQSITDKLTPGMRQGLPGSASERDTEMFRSATVGTGKDREANKNVATGLLTSKEIFSDQVKFKQEYFDKNKTLRGAEVKWTEYLEANPVFDPDAPEGSYDLNPNRQGYKAYFKGDWAPQTVSYGGKKYKFTDQKKYNAWLKAAGK